MKKTMHGILYSLLGLTALYPAGTILCYLLDYRFLLLSNDGFAVFLGLFSSCAVILSLVFPTEVSKTAGTVAAFMPFVTLVSCFFLLHSKIGVIGVAGLLVAFVCACAMTLKYAKNLAMKIVVLVIGIVLAVHVGFLGFLAMIFGSIGKDTVVQSVESPNGAYIAQLVDSDQGALGGDTLVLVYEQNNIDLFFLRIEKEPQLVYSGQWGAFKQMKLEWKNEHCLLINETEYEIE